MYLYEPSECLIRDREGNNMYLYEPSGTPNFEHFFEMFSRAVDEHCKLERPKLTKRTPTNNPWITDSIIDAIDHKEVLYDNWVA